MAIDLNSLQEFSDAELLKLVRLAIAEIAAYGQIRTIRNKTIQAAQLRDLQALQVELGSKVSAATTGRVRNYVRRRRS